MTARSTTLFAAALLLLTGLATASHASAGPTTQSHCYIEMGAYCVPDPDWALDSIDNQCGPIQLWAACVTDIFAMPVVSAFAGPELCGRQATRNQVESHPTLGTCDSSRTWTPPSTYTALDAVLNAVFDALSPLDVLGDPVGLAGDLAWWGLLYTLDFVDGDGDSIPDIAEPWICSVENKNTSMDGRCVGDNYYP